MKPAGSTDYRDFREKGKPPKQGVGTESSERRWWEQQGKNCAGAVKYTLDALRGAQSARLRQLVVSARLYGNTSVGVGINLSLGAAMLPANNAVRDRVTQNETQTTIDTLVSRIGENKPRPYFLTSGGNYRQQRRAKKLNQFVEGVFYETKAYDMGLEAFRDGCIWGDGFIHVYGRAGKVCHERVLPSELWVDEVEGQYGAPRNLHRVKYVDKDELAGLFPENRFEILRVSRDPDTTRSSRDNLSNMVKVAESWHLGTLDEDGETTGGKHVISLPEAGILLGSDGPDDWPLDFFPFAQFSWCRRPVGFWSQGLCEQAQGIQLELNKNLWLIQRSMHLAGSPKVFIANGSHIVKEEINNEIGGIIEYTGEPPQYVVPQPIHEIYFRNVDLCAERIRHLAGLNEMSTSAAKPAGLNSGKALREFEDIQSDRHRSTQRANDNLYLQLAALDIAVARELSKAGKLAKVRVPGKNAFQEIDFKKEIGASLKDSEFVMQCFPVSRLPRDPSGRLQTIQEYMQAGMLTLRQGRRLLDFPDLDSVEGLANAQEDVLSKVLDDIVDEGEYQGPQPTDDLELAKEMVIEYIQRYRLLDLEDEKMAMLRTFSEQVDLLQEMAAMALAPPMGAPGMPPPGPGMGAPQALPQAPPVSDLLPNAPGAVA
jgi:hypothetical protein